MGSWVRRSARLMARDFMQAAMASGDFGLPSILALSLDFTSSDKWVPLRAAASFSKCSGERFLADADCLARVSSDTGGLFLAACAIFVFVSSLGIHPFLLSDNFLLVSSDGGALRFPASDILNRTSGWIITTHMVRVIIM